MILLSIQQASQLFEQLAAARIQQAQVEATLANLQAVLAQAQARDLSVPMPTTAPVEEVQADVPHTPASN